MNAVGVELGACRSPRRHFAPRSPAARPLESAAARTPRRGRRAVRAAVRPHEDGGDQRRRESAYSPAAAARDQLTIGLSREQARADVRCWGWRSAGRKTAIADVAQIGGEQGRRYHRWRNGFGGLKLDQVRRLKGLELENSRAGSLTWPRPGRTLWVSCSPLRRRAAATFYAKTGPANALAF